MSSPLPALNERYTRTCFRLETLQDYAGVSAEEHARVASWLHGQRHFASLTDADGYLRPVAAHTLAGKRRSRVHGVTFPLTAYVRYELDAYRANVAVGERVGIVDAGDLDRELGPDFWLFDADSAHAEAVIMHFDPATSRSASSSTSRPRHIRTRVAELERQAALAQRSARSLEAVISGSGRAGDGRTCQLSRHCRDESSADCSRRGANLYDALFTTARPP